MKYALIDMGSNSIRLTVYDVSRDDFKILFKKKVMAGLAGFVDNGRLTREGIDCACHSVQAFQNTLQRLGIDNLAVFATASLRNISNTEEAVEQIRKSTGICVDVLSGKEEAECGYCGAISELKSAGGLFADIGGASTELVLFENGAAEKAGSIPIGSLRLYRDCVKKIIPGKGSQKRIERAITRSFEESDFADIPKQPSIIAVGGTVRAVLRLCIYLYGLPEDCRSFSKAQLEGLTRLLCADEKKAADLILRYAPERIHTLIPGVLILRYIVDYFGAESVTVSHYGVREGYLLKRIQPKLENDL